jgi:hypothetical protein
VSYILRFKGVDIYKVDGDKVSGHSQIGALEYANLDKAGVTAIEGELDKFMQGLFALGRRTA